MRLIFNGNPQEIAEFILQLQPQPELPKQNCDSLPKAARPDSMLPIKPPDPPTTVSEAPPAPQQKPFHTTPPSQRVPPPEQYKSTDSKYEKELYKIECKCGTEYFVNLFENATKLRCSECSQTVFVDRFVPKKISDYGKEATLATNRYRVAFTEIDDKY